MIPFSETSTASLLEENGKTLTPSKAALLLTNKNSARHHAIVTDRQLELAETDRNMLTDSQKLLQQNNSNSDVRQDDMLVIPLKHSPSQNRHHWQNELNDDIEKNK